MKKQKLRLILFENCNRNCQGCCNHDWNLKALPVCKSFSEYSEILLTGGEPMLKPNLIKKICKRIQKTNPCPIYLYTAKLDNVNIIIDLLTNYLNGITITLHEQLDVIPFKILNSILLNNLSLIKNKSLRLNIFNNINIKNIDLSQWKIKSKIKWIKNCPLPTNEILMKLKT